MHLTAMGKKLCPGLFTLREIRYRLLPLIIPLLIFFLSLSTHSYSQGITLSLNNVAITTAFKEIQKQSPYRFVYTNEELAATRNINITVDNAPLSKVLELCFKDQPLNYTIEDKFIMIKAREKKTDPPMKVDNEIRGKVTNEKGEGIAGATVTIKGTQKAAPTDNNGEFILADATTGSVIVITTIGYETQEFIVGKNRYLNVRLQVAVSSLDEMVLKGYYNTTKRLNTGNVSKVSAEVIEQQPISNPLEALEGRMTGVYVQQTTGTSGGGFNIQIRGQNSLRTISNNSVDGNLPLYVIDGVPFNSTSLSNNDVSNAIIPNASPLSYINSYDIESIDVLKDADATAIYGSRGSNGVVLITTKKGKAGKTKVDINLYSGIGKVTRTMNLLNTKQYLAMRNEAKRNDNSPVFLGDYDINGTWDTTRYTDWQKVLIGGTSQLTNAQANVSGGNENTQFIFGGGYYRATTVFPGDFADQKGSGHININHLSENKKFKTTLSVSYLVDNNNLLSVDRTSFALSLPPDSPQTYNANGSLNWANSTWTNPFSSLLKKYKGNTGNLITNSILSYQIISGLQIKTNLGYNEIEMNETTTTPLSSQNPASSPVGTAVFAKSSVHTWIIEPQLEFEKEIKYSRLSVLFGTTFQQNITEGQSLLASGYTSDALLESISAAPSVRVSNASYSKYRYNALFGRVNYNLKEKYLINLTGRRDGSSRFGPGKQFGNFGAVGGAWIFSRERFIQKGLSILSYGKLRASYGTTGSDQIGDYGYIDSYSSTPYSYNGTSGLLLSRLPSADYSWEINKKMEATIELGFAKDRILFTASWYRNRSSNQLVGFSLPVITGQASIQSNLPATIQNTGWEFEFSSLDYKNKNFELKTIANFTIPRNILVAYPNIKASSYAYTYQVGQPLNILVGYHFLGVNPQNGSYQYANKVAPTSSPLFPDDYIYTKKTGLNFYGSLQNSLKYKRWELNIFFQLVKQEARNSYLANFATPGFFSNQPTIVMDRWRKPGDVSDIQQFTQSAGSISRRAYRNLPSSDAVINDASFIRLKNLTLAYQLPASWATKIRFQNIRIYLQGQNLFTITKYIGLDPESQSFLLAPPLRILTAGINVNI